MASKLLKLFVARTPRLTFPTLPVHFYHQVEKTCLQVIEANIHPVAELRDGKYAEDTIRAVGSAYVRMYVII